jgi:hypothetical protein
VISGTAASGAAIAGGAVDAKCATGSGSATTAADGTYTVTISGGVLPCVVRVTTGATVLHSLALGSGQSALSDITPVTELTVARLSASVPSTYYAAFGAASAAGLTSATAQAAAAAVVDTLKIGGVDFSAIADVLAGPLAAAHGTVAGDAYDQVLDALETRLVASGTGLADLTQAVALSAPAAAVSTRSDVAALPPELLLAAAAPNCSSLRSGKYRIIVNDDGGTAPATGTITVDAPALTFVDTMGVTQHLTQSSGCVFTNPDGGEVIFNKAGVGISRVAGTGAALHAALLFPEQTHAVAELAGDYKALAFDRTATAGPIHLTSSSFSLNTAGTVTTINFCDDLRTCTVLTGGTLPSYSANAAGGFDVADTTAGSTHRVFAYRAGGGELLVVELAQAGHITLATRDVAVTLPAVGRVEQFWNVFADSLYTAPAAVSVTKSTVASVDAATGAFVRDRVQNSTTGATRPETLEINSLRSGYVHRVAATGVVDTDGGVSNVAEYVALTLRCMDMSVVGRPAIDQLGLSLQQ